VSLFILSLGVKGQAGDGNGEKKVPHVSVLMRAEVRE
jgi:hypothetical protein